MMSQFAIIVINRGGVYISLGEANQKKGGIGVVISLENLEAMRCVAANEVDKDSLVDIRDVNVNQEKGLEDKVFDFIKQIGNPYLFKYRDTVVRVNFSDTDLTFEDCMKDAFFTY